MLSKCELLLRAAQNWTPLRWTCAHMLSFILPRESEGISSESVCMTLCRTGTHLAHEPCQLAQ